MKSDQLNDAIWGIFWEKRLSRKYIDDYCKSRQLVLAKPSASIQKDAPAKLSEQSAKPAAGQSAASSEKPLLKPLPKPAPQPKPKNSTFFERNKGTLALATVMSAYLSYTAYKSCQDVPNAEWNGLPAHGKCWRVITGMPPQMQKQYQYLKKKITG